MYKGLDQIDSPKDLKKLSRKDLPKVCEDIRRYMVECCAVNPGHLGSSLGAVEIIVGLHYVYDTPEDKIVFDVGHQAYAHKILTGRREAFRGNRKAGGISGFPRRDESPYDAFGAGHSSTSISAALGFAEAARLSGQTYKSVALIGDGALTGGLAWEGLNNAGASNADILVILNDNNFSIDKPIGGLHDYLLKVTTSSAYNRLKRRVWTSLGESKFRARVQRWVISTKSNIVRSSGGDLFEALGFRYFGPIDGNDIDQVTTTLSKLRNLKGPRILHCITKKGAGYAPAEADPTVWHAPGKFDPLTGQRQKKVYDAARYQDVFGKTLVELAKLDGKVVGITPAMASGCGMTQFQQAFPERFFDVGIEEEHAVTFSAALAAGGLKPFCNIYSSFSQRAYDQIIHDVALQKLPVTLCLDRAGLVGEDGATHQGAFDLAAFRSIPNCTVAAPRNELELRSMMHSALSAKEGPYIIRYPRGTGEGVQWEDVPVEPVEPGRGVCLAKGKGLAILALGPVANRAFEAAERHRIDYWVGPSVYDMRFLKPIDTSILEEIANNHHAVLTIEDGALKGGLYSAVCEFFAPRDNAPIIRGLGIPDKFITHDTQAAQRESCCLSTEEIFDIVRDMMKK